MPADYALIIGINDYTPVGNGGLKTLNGAITDADRIERWLLDPEGGMLDRATCKKIISSPNPLRPLIDDIDDALMEIVQDIVDNGEDARRFYFYFAGHGSGVEKDFEDTALCITKWSERRRNYALSIEAILHSGSHRQMPIDLCHRRIDILPYPKGRLTLYIC